MNTTESRKYLYRGYTLIDISATDVTRESEQKHKERNQQRNWETVQQVLGLRTQILELEQQRLKPQDMTRYQFGSVYEGVQNIWRFDFAVEFENIFKIDDDPIAVLVADFNSVPVIQNLDETVKLSLPMFLTLGDMKNIYFMAQGTK